MPPPAAVRWWNGKSALLDFTHPNAAAWFDEQLGRLVRDYGVDGFKFDGGGVLFYAGSDGVEGGSLKKMYAYDPSVSPSAQSALYGQFALKYKGSEYRNGFGFAGKPVIMRLHDKAHSWDALRRLVPDMMAAGFVGCPFICPDMIGGGVWTAFLPGAPFDPELFIRSAQVHALCPMMRISASPWRVLDAQHQKVFRKTVELRQRFAPHFVELARESAKTGEPMMRNLEYCFPGVGYAEIKDEFMMGDNLLVAPVLEKGAKSRRVVIPPGRWRGDDGKIVEGPVNVEVSTPLDRLPHFVRLSTDLKPFVKPTLVPGPQSAEYRLDRTFSLVDGFAVSVSCPEDGAAEWITSHVPLWFDVTPRVTSAFESSVSEDEGFEISVDERGVTVSAKRLIGVKYAMYTFRQMAVPCRGTMTLTGWEMPFARIFDAPKMKWRGFHFCGMRKFSPSDVEHFLRMAAYYRYNHFVFEDHGGFKSERYPWYSFGEATVTPADIRRLKAIADDLGISLVPAINCYGHSAKSSEGGYEHVALDGHPELQPLFEPDYGWNWCVTNPETRKVVKGLLEELLDVFGGPKYVHIGFDEANPPSCRTCASGEWYRHVADYLGDLAGFLREKGATAMVWHDQFLVKDDPRWFGFVHAGGKDAEKLLDAIPKDVIICDWYYGGGLDDYPTLTYFKDKGFRVFTSPWGAVSSWASQRNGGGFTQIAWAVEHGFDGAMTTTWGVCDGEDRDREFLMADFMWGHPIKAARDYLYKTNNDWRWSHRYIATHWRQVGWDMLKEARN